MAQLIGLHNPIGTFPTFLIPIFREHEGSNTLSVQIVNDDGLVEDFDPTIVTIDNIIKATRLLSINKGDDALWSFAFTESDFEINVRRQLANWLRQRLDELVNIPFLYLEVTEFIGDHVRRNQALHSVFLMMSETSREQAEAWRNFDVILPEARAGIRELIAANGREAELGSALHRLKLQIARKRPIIIADNPLVELVSQSRGTNRRALARASAVVSAFDLLPPTIRPRETVEKMITRARPSGRRLSAEEAAMVKAMLIRGDRHHDIAAWFGVNQGRIAEVKSGELFPEVSPADPKRLPPQGSPGRIALKCIEALEQVRDLIEEGDARATENALRVIGSTLEALDQESL
jgi:hypothetical protein